MKILIASDHFYPTVGGIQTMSLMLAQEFVARGHEVVLVTGTRNSDEDHFAFKVLRRPSKVALLRLVKWSDVYFQNNISLRTLWPLLFVVRPWVVAHHTWIRRANGSLGWQDRLKRILLRYANAISISRAIANDVSAPSVVIGNPYLHNLFRILPDVPRDRDLVFLGRLVTDKGAHLLLSALQILRSRGLSPTVTIIGTGPELECLKRFAFESQMGDQVEFAGQKSGEDLVVSLNRHRIMIVPSVWQEPFGIVALEGIACGCVVVGSAGGGLSDAIGPCGLTFKNSDVNGLAAAIEQLLRDPSAIRDFLQAAPEHLGERSLTRVADQYLAVLEAAAGKRTGRAAGTSISCPD